MTFRGSAPVITNAADRSMKPLENGGFINLNFYEAAFASVEPTNALPPRVPVAPSQEQLHDMGGYIAFQHGPIGPGNWGTLPSQHSVDPFHDFRLHAMYHDTPGKRVKPVHLLRQSMEAKSTPKSLPYVTV